MDLSSEPEARVMLSGDQAMVLMPARWARRVCRWVPWGSDQIFIVASEEEVARSLDEGEILTEEMEDVWDLRVWRCW